MIYMCPGEYTFDPYIEYLVRTDENTQKKARQLLRIKHSHPLIRRAVNIFRKAIFKKRFLVTPQSNAIHGFSGSIFTPTNSANGNSNMKIFDLINNKVLTIFSNERDYWFVLNAYEHFKDHFPVPAILGTDKKQLVMLEELIKFKPRHTWGKEDFLYVMEDIFQRYSHYFKEYVLKGISSLVSPADLVPESSKNQFTLFIKDKINSELLHLQIPTVNLHGDLWTANTLIKHDNSQIYFIDWEYSKELLFFYDFFTMMWIEVYENENYIYIEKYVKGDYDYYFSSIFSLFKLTFIPSYRIDYFHIFFLNYIHERLKNYDKKGKEMIFTKYKMLIEKMERQLEKKTLTSSS